MTRKSRRPRLYPIRDPRQIEALATPARQEVIDALQVNGPCSVAELAASLGRAPDSLYYHVRKLEKVGLIVPAGARTSGAREEILYDTPASRVAIDVEPETPEQKKSLMRLVSSALRMAERDLRAALDAGLAVYRRSTARNAWGGRVKGWLTDEELATVRDHIEAVNEIVLRSRQRSGSALHAVTFVMTPIVPTERTRTERKDR